MTIGFIVSFFDFRNDVRRVIEILSVSHKVVVFFKSSDESLVLNHKLPGVEYRPIIERKSNWKNIIAEQLFLYLKKLPASRNNYFLMELLKISNLKSKKAVRKGNLIIKLQQILPCLISYDQLLKWLRSFCKTQISDIDRFIFFTEITDDYLLSRLLRENKDIVTYVYSWDHPCKHTRFSRQVQYYCWSEGIKKDIEELQKIDPKKITVTGASQFGYIFEFLNSKSQYLHRTYAFDYIYFGCGIGIKKLVPQEVEVIKQLAEATYKEKPDLKFVVRPYPVLDQWSLYGELKILPNIILDDSFRNKDLSISDAEIYSKFEKIWHAKAFLHLGTTLGLEACFTETPSFIINFGYKKTNGLSVYAFIHQYQNDKYLGYPSKENTLENLGDYVRFLKSNNPTKFLKINYKVQREFPLQSFSEFCKRLISQ